MRNFGIALGLVAVMCFNALISLADTVWTSDLVLDNVTPGNEFTLQNSKPITTSTLWAVGDNKTAVVVAKADGVEDYVVKELSDGEETYEIWDYTKVNPVRLPRDKVYSLSHTLKVNGTTVSEKKAEVTILPEPCLAVLLGLFGLLFLGRKSRKVAVCAILLASVAASATTISNVSAHQRWPWDGNMDIDFTVSNENAGTYSISFQGKIGDGIPFALTTLSGIGADGTVTVPGTYRITWNSDVDCPGTDVTNFKLAITVEDDPLPEYLKVDLANGSYTEVATAPESWTKDDKTKYMWFKRIPAGTFKMGSPSDEKGHYNDETEHYVTLSEGYWMAVFEMTEGQYDYITGATKKSNSDYAQGNISYDALRGGTQGAGWPGSSSVDPSSIIGKLRTLVTAPSGFRFDLPTEAQWEYACRAGNGAGKWNDGSDIQEAQGEDSNLNVLGWYAENSDDEIQIVGGKNPNSWGLYDMHGNAYEWCLDWYGDYPEKSVSDPVGPESHKDGWRVGRSGSYGDNPCNCRSAARVGSFGPDTEMGINGARLAIVK